MLVWLSALTLLAVVCLATAAVLAVLLWAYVVLRMFVWCVEWLERRLHPDRVLEWPAGTPGR